MCCSSIDLDKELKWRGEGLGEGDEKNEREVSRKHTKKKKTVIVFFFDKKEEEVIVYFDFSVTILESALTSRLRCTEYVDVILAAVRQQIVFVCKAPTHKMTSSLRRECDD